MTSNDRWPPAALHLPQLATLVGEDAEVQRQLLTDYLRCARHEVAQIRLALQQGDLPAAGALAHKLRSASHAVGAHALAAHCAWLERCGPAGAAIAHEALVHFDALSAHTLQAGDAQLAAFGTPGPKAPLGAPADPEPTHHSSTAGTVPEGSAP